MTGWFAMAMWAVDVTTLTARIAFRAQTVRLPALMKKIRSGVLPVLLLAAGFASVGQAASLAAPVHAGAGIEPFPSLAEPRDGISLDQAVSRAEAQYNARVVRTDVVDEDGRKVYVLKLLSESGRVFTVRVDADSGRMR
jgi:hypothetical protein